MQANTPSTPPPAAPAPLMELRHVSKAFGNVRALHDINLALYPATVVGLVGDNGAGKSTLIKVITGFHKPDGGEMSWCGRPVTFGSPGDARAIGIETVYQDLALVEEMSIWRNFYLGKELRRPLGILDTAAMKERCHGALTEMGIRLRSADEPVSILSGGERQAVAIARAVFFGARVLILDEPTAALAVKETQKVLDAVAGARARGLAVVLITHNLAQAHAAADRIVIVEHGQVVTDVASGEVEVEHITAVVGRA